MFHVFFNNLKINGSQADKDEKFKAVQYVQQLKVSVKYHTK